MKSTGVNAYTLKPLYTAFLHGIKISGYKVRIKPDKNPLAVKQNNSTAKIVNTYIVLHLDNWPNNPLRNFIIKDFLFGANSIVKNSDKEKWVYHGCGVAFQGKGTRNFSNDFATNVVIFGTDNGSSSHADNPKNSFLILGEGPTKEKKFSVNFSKANTTFCLSLLYNGDNNYLIVNGKETFKFKANNGNFNFPT